MTISLRFFVIRSRQSYMVLVYIFACLYQIGLLNLYNSSNKFEDHLLLCVQLTFFILFGFVYGPLPMTQMPAVIEN